MVHIRPLHSHNRYFGICPIKASSPVSWHKIKWCLVSTARRWLLASCHQLPITCQPCASSWVQRGRITWHKIRTAERVVHYLLATAPQLITSPIGSMGPIDFHLFRLLKKHQASKKLAIDTNIKQAVISWLQTPETDFFYARIQVLMPQKDKWCGGLMHTIC